MRNPDIHRRVREELMSHLDPNTRYVSYADAQNLPYFDACVKEAFRIHPPSGFVMERVVPAEGAQIGGYTVPGNVIVGCTPWTVHRDKATFGIDADVYRPERWIDASEEQSRNMKQSMLHFGSGPHTCMGRHISVIEVYKLGVSMLKNYNVRLPSVPFFLLIGANTFTDHLGPTRERLQDYSRTICAHEFPGQVRELVCE